MRFTLPKPTWRRSLSIIAVSALIIVISFVLWANSTNPIDASARAALEDSAQVDVSQGAYLSFMPKEANPRVGYILYPGGRVLAEAYAPIAHAIAEQGYFVAIVYAPLNLAFFNVGAANAVIAEHPEIEAWAVGGHSLGGVAATLFADSQADKVRGLVIMASFPANGNLAQRNDLQVVSIYGTEDGLASVENILASADDLPAGTRFVAIEGGNHAQFGAYGAQSGDKPASISAQDQLEQIVSASTELLASLAP